MDTVNRILIVFDLYKDFREESNPIPVEVRNAIRLISDKQTAHLILVGCGIEEYLRDSYSKFGRDAIAKRREYCNILEAKLHAVADNLKKQHYQVTFIFLRTYPRYEHIAQLSKKYDVDLVVQHVNSNASPQRFLPANDSWQLARICPRSLLIVKNKDWKISPVIIAVVDPMPSYHRPLPYHSAILDVAFQAKVQLHGNLHVVHAYSQSPWPFSNTESLRNKHKKALVEMLASYSIDQESVHLVDKTPLYALLDYKEKLEADIIIMDTLSKSKFTEAISGNSTKSVLDYLQSDLLIVKQGYAKES